MAYQIVWTKKARESAAKVIDYLEVNWSIKVADEFVNEMEHHLSLLASGILNGTLSARSNKVRSVLITKHNRFTTEKVILLPSSFSFEIPVRTL